MKQTREPMGADITFVDTEYDEIRTEYFSFGDYQDDDRCDSYGVNDLRVYFYTTYPDVMAHDADPSKEILGDYVGTLLDINYNYQYNADEVVLSGLFRWALRFMTAGSHPFIKRTLLGILSACILVMYVNLIVRGL